MKRALDLRESSFVTITAAGFAATVAQILLLRELLILFHGNEMSTALVLAGWLLWTALGSAVSARLAVSRPPRVATLALLLALQALGLPALVLVVRGARWLFGIPFGVLATMGQMLLLCLMAPVLFSPIAGALFGSCWAYRRTQDVERASRQPLAIYLGEALGAATGGIVFYFVMLRSVTALTASVVVALLLLAVSGWILWRNRSAAKVGARRPAQRPDASHQGSIEAPGRQGVGTGRYIRLVWTLATLLVLALAVGGRDLDAWSRRWQWGESLIAAMDTPFHNIAALEQCEQVTVFINGLWLWTEPDPATAELAVHTALLQHRNPRQVLLLGGGLAGQVMEVLKHPGLERLDYVEQDPELIAFSDELLSDATRRSLREPRVRIEREDAGTFLRGRRDTYDVILMNVGDPINAQMNRFYTEEAFRRLGEHLRPGGILTFSVPGGGDMVGPSHARFLGSIHQALVQVFPAVRVLPGERARFFAAHEEASLVMEPTILAARSGERGLELVHLREDTLQYLMSPLRLEYIQSVLAELGQSRVNRQFSPICYFHGMMLWAAQWQPAMAHWIDRAAAIQPQHLFAAVGAVGVLVSLFFWRGRPRYRAAVGASVFVQGAWGMVLQVVLILSFQILAGFAYLQLALIIAFFMAGLAAGTLGIAALRGAWGRDSTAIGWLAGLQAGVTALPLVLLVFLSPVSQEWREGLSPTSVSWVFTTVSFLSGVLGGSHFSLAALATTATGARLERTGGYLYAIDLLGAAGGALVAGLFVLPLYGVASTLVLLSLLSLICLVAILRRPKAM